ncbi:MAG: hypothetical protein Q9214_004406, partial [Letrouitia sp. 1 TL-2023]
LQRRIRRRTQCRFSNPTSEDEEEDRLSQPKAQDKWNHCALERVFRRISTSLTAFDRFECDDHDWLHKYVPRSAEEVLQNGPEATILRDWLNSLAVNSVERTDSDDRKARNKMKRKKRKRSEELDDFIISSDEEASELNELSLVDDGLALSQKIGGQTVVQTSLAPDSTNRGNISANAVIISGPHGSGKSATVYAVAQELGFEVFEINSGSRRSGKDVLDRVGDMTRNHLVYPARPDVEVGLDKTEDLECLDDSLKQDIESGRQGTMNAFFGPKPFERKRSKSKSKGLRNQDRKEKPKQQQSQKQSVILLEEVDVLFEEDKQFWATILELVQHSKRPIIMTCTDESLLPLEELPLFAILRYHPPPESLAVDYLLLLACNEGHLLAREPVFNLYKERNHDLRASIIGLQFYCQMAIGDSKGGLDWMLIRPTSDPKAIETGQPLRVVSEDTYPININWVRSDYAETESSNPLDKEAELLSHVWSGWGVDLASWEKFLPSEIRSASPHERLKALETFDEATNAMSAADVIPGQGYFVDDPQQLNLSDLELTEKARANFTERPTLVQADPLVDCTGLSTSISLALKVYARGLCCANYSPNKITRLTDQAISDVLPDLAQDSRYPSKISCDGLNAAFEPLAKTSKSLSSWTLSAFNAPIAILLTDLAPYIRSIISFDLRLEEHRRQLSLLTQGNYDGKRMRTTRASRAALEGGSKSTTRRERWFPPSTNFGLVLQSGGPDWQKIGLLRSAHQPIREEPISPPEESITPSKSSHSQSLFNDEQATGAASSSLFSDSTEDGASPWNMPTPKKAGRSQVVKNLLPANSVPESYVDAFDTLVDSGYRTGSGSISLAGARKIFEGSGLDAAEQSKIINLVASGQELSNGLSRSEFNVLIALAGLAQEKEDITLDGVDERRRNLPEPPLPAIKQIRTAKVSQNTEESSPPLRDATAASDQPSPSDSTPKSRRLRRDTLENLDADPWGSPAMHKGHTYTVNNEATPSTNGTTAARPLGGAAGSARTTSSFTTHSAAPDSTSSTLAGNDGSTRDPNHGNAGGWGSFGNPGHGGLDGGGFGGSGGDQGHAGGRSLGGGRTNRDIGETITVTLLPDKEGMFMFQHRNYEVRSARRGSTVIRRYSDFVWLLDCLHKRYPFRQLPLLPPKRVA